MSKKWAAPSTDCTHLIRSTLRLRRENSITLSLCFPLRLSFCHLLFIYLFIFSSGFLPSFSLLTVSEFKGAAWREYKCPRCQRSKNIRSNYPSQMNLPWFIYHNCIRLLTINGFKQLGRLYSYWSLFILMHLYTAHSKGMGNYGNTPF